jgi:hypothetical protein
MDTAQLKAFLKRIDTVIRELQALRQVIVAQYRPVEGPLTQQLYCVLGQGTWEEYDPFLDWQRFGS